MVSSTIGQRNLLSGEIEGLESLVNQPQVLEHSGLRVVGLIIPEKERRTQGYESKALELANKLAPNIQSRARPVWLQKDWQTKRRKKKAGY